MATPKLLGGPLPAELGPRWAHTRTMVCTPCAEDGMDVQSCTFVVTFSQLGTLDPTNIGSTSQGKCCCLGP